MSTTASRSPAASRSTTARPPAGATNWYQTDSSGLPQAALLVRFLRRLHQRARDTRRELDLGGCGALIVRWGARVGRRGANGSRDTEDGEDASDTADRTHRSLQGPAGGEESTLRPHGR